MNKRFFTAVLLSLLWPVWSHSAASVKVTAGGQIVNVVPNSSKFNEYRDVRDGVYLYDFGVSNDTADGMFLELGGSNAGRDDQSYRLSAGRPGACTAEVTWDEIPHRLSFKARTPYTHQGSGLYMAPVSPIVTKSLVPTAPQQLVNDSATAAYLRANLRPINLGNDREKLTGTLNLFPMEGLRLRLTGSNEERDGNKISYGPIGDRPPRTLNIQMEEPIDYQTREVKFEADYSGKRSQANFTYELSEFWNRIDDVTWQNIYVNPAVGSFELWDRAIASFGRRPLPQDNTYQNFSLTYGVDLPMASRLTAAASYGLAEQNNPLLPYSTNGSVNPATGKAWTDIAALPRFRTEAEHVSKHFTLDYVAHPLERTRLRAFGRYFGVKNNTPVSAWSYVTQDVTTAAGAVTYLNKRKNVDFEYAKQNFGLEGDYSLPFWSTTLGLGYEQERTDRKHREADTVEHIVRTSARARPVKWLNAQLKYQYGKRDAGHYEEVVRESYWYAAADATAGTADSQFTFENHPDTRRWDVTDRQRHQVDFKLAAAPVDALDVSLTHRYRRDDFASKVSPSQPLLNYAGVLAATPADRVAFTPGDQVGLLKETRQSVAVDASYQATKRMRFSLYGSRERADSRQRGFEFQENNKADPSSVAAGTELGPWTRRTGQWMADIQDTTYSYGAGADVDLIPEKLVWNANYTHSIGEVGIDYSGMGAVSSVNGAVVADNNQFGFRTPPVIRNDRYVIGSSVEYSILKDLTVGLGYLFDYFKQRDWQQDADTPWSESVDGAEEATRDSSRSNQWGNRLPIMGTYLAPSYQAHVVSLKVAYRF